MITISLFYCWEKVLILMNDWKKFDEASLPEKENFYSDLKVKYITDVDYAHKKEFVKNLK